MKALLFLVAISATACFKGSNPQPDLPDGARADAPSADTATVCFAPQGTPPNCFQQNVCEPTEDVDFLNGCTDGQCIAFDNAARLPLYNNGTLPALP